MVFGHDDRNPCEFIWFWGRNIFYFYRMLPREFIWFLSMIIRNPMIHMVLLAIISASTVCWAAWRAHKNDQRCKRCQRQGNIWWATCQRLGTLSAELFRETYRSIIGLIIIFNNTYKISLFPTRRLSVSYCFLPVVQGSDHMSWCV